LFIKLFWKQINVGDAKELLDKIAELQREQIRSIDALQATYEKVAELSNMFYELIPHVNFSHDRIKPFNDYREVQLKMTMINNLIDLEVASKILLGALASQEKINPLDYCYKVRIAFIYCFVFFLLSIHFIHTCNKNAPFLQLLI
jgi:hypothetical protein